MMLFLKKQNEEQAAEKPMPTQAAAQLADYVPYYAHYNPHTLLTKNGELLQVIKISSNNRGLTYESGDATQNTLRDNIRRAITDHTKSNAFAFWIHTFRKRKPISYNAGFDEPLAAYVHDRWQKKHRWKFQYYNEIYITVLHDGQHARLLDKKNMRQLLLRKRNREFRNQYFDRSIVELDTLTDAIIRSIGEHYNARRLSMAERISADIPGQAVFYSEPMEFLGSILNLRDEQFPVPDADLSTALCTHKITFGFNAVEAKNTAGARRFGAMLTLKQYHEVTTETVDRILQSPTEMIISQALHFVPHTKALKKFREQKEMLDISGDQYSVERSGLAEMLRANKNKSTDFSNHQTSIMVLVDEYKQLEPEIVKMQQAFTGLGLIAVREDIKLEECFWAQLPGNFEFLRRTEAISTKRLGGFCRLNLFPNGQNTGNHWGEALALIPTSVSSPYFFNFHQQDNGHALMFDFNSFHDHAGNVTLNFLLTSSLKYHPRMFVFDRAYSSYLFFDKLGGQYHSFSPAGESSHHHRALNPFALEGTPRNQGFLLAWCEALIEPQQKLNDEQKQILQQAIAALYAAPAPKNLAALVEHISPRDAALAAAFRLFLGQGKYAGLFDASGNSLDVSAPLQAFNMDGALKHQLGVPLFAYLLHRIIDSIDGRPTMIVLHDAWELMENSFFAPRLESLLEMLTQNNIMVIFVSQNPVASTGLRIFKTVMKHCSTHMYIPDDIAFDYNLAPLGLSAHDARMLSRMERQHGEFLLKQGNESISLSANFDELDDIRAIYAGDVKNLIAAGGPYASLPKEY